jgi:Tol biopolymer transport system component
MERNATMCNTTTCRPPARGPTRRSSASPAPGRRSQRWHWRVSSLLLLLLLALPALPAGVVKIERLSPPPLDVEVPLASFAPAISADGRFVGFTAEGDIYLHDRLTGKKELVSVAAAGGRANGHSWLSAISADGRIVAFQSDASNLVPQDNNGVQDVFVRDWQAGKTELVSVAADGTPANRESGAPSISADGRFVAFQSYATNLVPVDTSGGVDIFVRDRRTGKTEIASIAPNGEPTLGAGFSPSISADGRFVAFVSEVSDPAPGDEGGIYVRDRQTGKTELASVSSSGALANGWCYFPAISGDGRCIVFASPASNLVPGGTGDHANIFLRDRQTGKTELVSIAADGTPANGESMLPAAISGDGRFVAFQSNATNLVPGGTSGEQIFVRDRQTGSTERVAGGEGSAISGDGRFVAFTSGSEHGIAVRDRMTLSTELITLSGNVGRLPLDSYSPAISADGQWVAFMTAGQVFERNRVTGATALVSASPRGVPANSYGYPPAISTDGRFIAFASWASNLVPEDTHGQSNVFVWDRQTGSTELVSMSPSGAPANGWTWYAPAISADGRFVAFASSANNLVPGYEGGIFVRDRQAGKTELVSVAANGALASGYSSSPSISADGRFVAFQSWADNLVPGDTDGDNDIFVRDRQTGKTELVSVNLSGAPAGGNFPAISGDGRFVAFASWSGNLVPGDTSSTFDVFVRDRQAGKTELVSVSLSGAPAGASGWPALSGDGRFVTFQSGGDSLVPGDTIGGYQIFVRDRNTGTTEMVSVTPGGVPANEESGFPAISADGRSVAFESDADNLVPGDTNGRRDVFVTER